MPNLRSSHDMALWLNLLKQEKYAYGIAQDLAIYRDHKSSNTSNKFKAAYDVWNVYRQHEKLNLFYSIYNFVICFFLAALARVSATSLKSLGT